MVSLRGIYSARAFEVERLLNLGKGGLPKAKAILIEELASGNADPLVQKLAAKVFSPGKKGRPATGLYRWFEIGNDNSNLRDDGMSHRERLELLSTRYGRSTDHVEKCITAYDLGEAAAREHEHEAYDADRGGQ